MNENIMSVIEQVNHLTEAVKRLAEEVKKLERVTRVKTPSPNQHLRPTNAIPLHKALRLVLQNGPLNKREILVELGKIGYTFAAQDPMMSLKSFIYKKKNGFKKEAGRFSI